MNKLTVFLERLYLRLLMWLIGGRTVVANARVRGSVDTNKRALVFNDVFAAATTTDEATFISLPAHNVGIIARVTFMRGEAGGPFQSFSWSEMGQMTREGGPDDSQPTL